MNAPEALTEDKQGFISLKPKWSSIVISPEAATFRDIHTWEAENVHTCT